MKYDSDQRLSALEHQVAELQSKFAERGKQVFGFIAETPHGDTDRDLASPREWWCLNVGKYDACFWSRGRCRTDAALHGGTCLLTDAPWCIDVDTPPSSTEPHVYCYQLKRDCDEDESIIRRNHAIMRHCYRASDGLALKKASGAEAP